MGLSHIGRRDDYEVYTVPSGVYLWPGCANLDNLRNYTLHVKFTIRNQ